MIYALLVLHGFVTLAMIGIILLQKSDDSGPLGIGGGGNNALFTARGVANILTRSTAVLGALFIGNCILIDRLTSKDLNKHQVLFAGGEMAKEDSAPSKEEKESGQLTDSSGEEGAVKTEEKTPETGPVENAGKAQEEETATSEQ